MANIDFAKSTSTVPTTYLTALKNICTSCLGLGSGEPPAKELLAVETIQIDKVTYFRK